MSIKNKELSIAKVESINFVELYTECKTDLLIDEIEKDVWNSQKKY